jgi:protein-L-isoaspartate O-methyltransferase
VIKEPKMKGYVHGYSKRESERLSDQADCLSDLLHHDSVFPEGSVVLEAGCGVGAQTRIIAPKNPGARFISIDISEESVRMAKETVESLGIANVEVMTGDISGLDFDDGFFDHIIVCFVLEHLADPLDALKSLKRVLKKGGTVTLIEGDHGSAYFHPDSVLAREVISAQIKIQSDNGGDALIGRRLYPLLTGAGFKDCSVSPRMVYADSSRPELVEGFTKNTFTAMIEGIRDRAVGERIVDGESFDTGIRDLYRTTEQDGVFCYTFFKGTGYND